MPLVHPFLRKLITPPKPRIVGIQWSVSAGTPITITFPPYARAPGIFMLLFIVRHAGGTAGPGLPTGFTTIQNSATVAPHYRIAGKVFDGSEALTTTSAATSATSMTAIAVAISGVRTAVAASGDPVTLSTTATATSTTPNATALPAIGAGARRAPSLQIVWNAWNGSASVSEFTPGFPLNLFQNADGANGGQAISAEVNQAPMQQNPAASLLSASVVNRANILNIMGA